MKLTEFIRSEIHKQLKEDDYTDKSVNEISWDEMKKIDTIHQQIKKHIEVNHKDSIDYKRDRWMKGYSDLVGHGGKSLNKKNLKNIAKLAKQKNDKTLIKLLSDLSNVSKSIKEYVKDTSTPAVGDSISVSPGGTGTIKKIEGNFIFSSHAVGRNKTIEGGKKVWWPYQHKINIKKLRINAGGNMWIVDKKHKPLPFGTNFGEIIKESVKENMKLNESMLKFVRDEASGGMIANVTGLKRYKEIDTARRLMIQILKKKNLKYSLGEFEKLGKQVGKFLSGERKFESVNEAISKGTTIFQIATPYPKIILAKELKKLFPNKSIITEVPDSSGYESVLMFDLSSADLKTITKNDRLGDVLVWKYPIGNAKEIISKESVNEAMSKDAKFKIYDKLKKGDKITIKFDDAIRRGNERTFIVSKGKTKVGKARVERIILKNVANPKGVKYYLYQRDGSVTLAVGNMAATIVDMSESTNEQGLTFHKSAFGKSVNEDLPTREIDPSQFPNPLSGKKGFLKKGNADGDKTDDIVKTSGVSISVSQLKPSQDAIYLGKALGLAIAGVEGGDLGAVISKDNYILDGHHRYAATTFNNPSAKVGGVQSDLVIGDLVPVLRAVGDAMKNKRGLAPKGGDVNIFKATMEDVKAAIYDGKNMDSKFYNKEKSIKWFERIGEETVAARLKMIQSKRPPSGAPARKDMPKIHPNQLGILKTLLNKGNIDVKEPYAESVIEAVSKIKMNNLDWGKSTAERNTNLDKYYSLKTDKERKDFLIKLKGESVDENKKYHNMIDKAMRKSNHMAAVTDVIKKVSKKLGLDSKKYFDKKRNTIDYQQFIDDATEKNESVNEAVSSSKIKASLDKQIDWANIADDEIKLYPKPIRIEPDKFDSQLKKYSKAFKNTLIYLYGTVTNKYNTTALFAVVSRLKSTTKIIFMSDKYAKAYGKGSLKDSDITGVLKMNSLIASNAELDESVNEVENIMEISAESQLKIAKTYGIIDQQKGLKRAPSQSKSLMKMLRGRRIGATPKGEAPSIELMKAWTDGWDSAKKDKSVNESKDIYFNSATDAVNHARKMIEKRGFEIDEDDWQSQIALGGKYGRIRPGVEKTTDATIGLLKNGKPQRKALQISLYGMPSGKYELTYYVN